MQRAEGHTGRKRIPPATLEMLARERDRGKSLRQLGWMLGVSHEHVRQVLAEHGPSRITLLAENRVAVKLGYPVSWLVQLREKGLISPEKPGGRWLYSEEQVKQIPSLIAGMRRCARCGGLRQPGYRKFCRECSQYRRKHYYQSLSPKEKAEYQKKSMAWRKTGPGKRKELSPGERGKSRAVA